MPKWQIYVESYEIGTDIKLQERETVSQMTETDSRTEVTGKRAENKEMYKGDISGRNQINMAKFGCFVAGRRGELGMLRFSLLASGLFPDAGLMASCLCAHTVADT